MIFQHTWNYVTTISPYTGKPKTLTTRIVSPDHELVYEGKTLIKVMSKKNGRVVWALGRSLAVQPGRGKAGVAHIVVCHMVNYDTRGITPEMIEREGFSDKFHYLRLWVQMHDSAIRWIEDRHHLKAELQTPVLTAEGRGAWLDKLSDRPPARYNGIGITFKVVV